MLSNDRADVYDSWIKVGWCLYNLGDTNAMLDRWIRFSKLSDKFEDGKCEEVWRTMRPDGGLNMGSLRYWAKEDNPAMYKAVFQNHDDINKITQIHDGTVWKKYKLKSGIRLVPLTKQCVVECDQTHEDNELSSIMVCKDCTIVSCLIHGNKNLPVNIHMKLINILYGKEKTSISTIISEDTTD